MGLNTIFSYVYWNQIESVQGTFDFTGDNDVTGFFGIAFSENLNIVLRPGPYICGERDWGGFPAWLANVDGLVVRSYNQPFLKAAESYLSKLADYLRPRLVAEGGNILMVQVENEYGSYGEDHQYTSAMKDILNRTFGGMLYTNDGGVDWTLEGGSVPGVLAAIDGEAKGGFASLRKHHAANPSQQGPLLNGEYYTYAPDIWGPNNRHATSQGQAQVVQQFVNDLDYVIGNESASISLYMVHGGTNFGFSNGALWQNQTRVFTSSYDYGSPIDESGRTTELYHALRSTILKYIPEGLTPDVPENIPRLAVPSFKLAPSAELFDNLPQKTTNRFPQTMENFNQSYGFILYSHTYNGTAALSGVLESGDRPRDRVIVYVDGVNQGVIDSQYKTPQSVKVNLKPGNKLQLLVENLGRVDYYSRETKFRNDVLDPFKGILGTVFIGGEGLETWDMYPLQLDNVTSLKPTNSTPSNISTPLFYRGTFAVNITSSDPAELDTYISIPAGVKGNVWVNGFHLGRYWRVGPQQSLYLPGTVIKPDGETNEVLVLELEPNKVKGEMSAVGLSERVWGNNPDPDCERCT
jgi:hypothetical protein